MLIRRLFIPLSLLLTVFALDTGVDHFFGDQTLAPVLSVLSLFILALLLPGKEVLLWVPLFAAESYWLIRDVSQFPKIRAATVLASGLLASWAARQREKLDDQHQEIEMMLLKLPTPWILIDEHGTVLRANNLGASWLGCSAEEIAGNSIFSVGTTGEEARKLRINDFVRLGKGSMLDQGVEFPLGTIHPTGKKVSAFIFSIPSRQKTRSLLVLREV